MKSHKLSILGSVVVGWMVLIALSPFAVGVLFVFGNWVARLAQFGSGSAQAYLLFAGLAIILAFPLGIVSGWIVGHLRDDRRTTVLLLAISVLPIGLTAHSTSELLNHGMGLFSLAAGILLGGLYVSKSPRTERRQA
jgi:hypothetical protein